MLFHLSCVEVERTEASNANATFAVDLRSSLYLAQCILDAFTI